MIIKESFLLDASLADILSAPSRLAAIPADGVLTIEASASDCDIANFGTLTLQPAEGEVPFDGLHIPANGLSTDDAILALDTELLIQLDVSQGGHVGLAYTENGTVALVIIMVTLTF